jgi:hypothetical protein
MNVQVQRGTEKSVKFDVLGCRFICKWFIMAYLRSPLRKSPYSPVFVTSPVSIPVHSPYQSSPRTSPVSVQVQSPYQSILRTDKKINVEGRLGRAMVKEIKRMAENTFSE